MSRSRAIRAQLLHCVAEPDVNEEAVQYWQDGLLVVDEGYVAFAGAYAEGRSQLTSAQANSLEHYPQKLLVPGFIDCHVHYPQTEMIAAHGKQLLEWLEAYTFPVESQFGDVDKSRVVAKVFLDELLNNGTTTALVFCSVHPESVDGFFAEAKIRDLRMIAGKVLMDRNAPANVLDTPERGYEQSKRLIEKWHGVDRLNYAITPRFAPTSTREQLALAGELLHEFPDLYMHTHLAENTSEIEWVRELFPESTSYLDVYDKAGLLGQRSVFAHGIHLCDEECAKLEESGAAIAHCPTSNLFIGSGLFPLRRLQAAGITIGLGTDVGGGSSFSMLRTLDEAYKIQQLQGVSISPEQMLYMATLGGAKALSIDDKVGSFACGNEADFLILDPAATPLLKFRTGYCKTWRELLFVLQVLGDDRAVWQTNIMGAPAKRPQ